MVTNVNVHWDGLGQIYNNPVTGIGILDINFKTDTRKKDCNKVVNTQSTTADKLKYHNTLTRTEYHKTGAGSTDKDIELAWHFYPTV